jgi:hypothetical protein
VRVCRFVYQPCQRQRYETVVERAAATRQQHYQQQQYDCLHVIPTLLTRITVSLLSHLSIASSIYIHNVCMHSDYIHSCIHTHSHKYSHVYKTSRNKTIAIIVNKSIVPSCHLSFVCKNFASLPMTNPNSCSTLSKSSAISSSILL